MEVLRCGGIPEFGSVSGRGALGPPSPRKTLHEKDVEEEIGASVLNIRKCQYFKYQTVPFKYFLST